MNGLNNFAPLFYQVQIFEGRHDIKIKGQAAVSRHVRDVGRLLTATELRSADRYWHVRQSGEKSGIYPTQYKPLVVVSKIFPAPFLFGILHLI